MATEQDTPPAPSKAVAAATAFVQRHGAAARGVVENLGRAGARIVLVGDDGDLGDVLVADMASGHAVIDQVEGLEGTDWDADSSAALKIGGAFRRNMAGPRAR